MDGWMDGWGQVRATTQIAALAHNTDNLEHLLMAGNVLAALSRTLREDGKKSIDLTINIISVFFSFSHFSQFHPVRSDAMRAASPTHPPTCLLSSSGVAGLRKSRAEKEEPLFRARRLFPKLTCDDSSPSSAP